MDKKYKEYLLSEKWKQIKEIILKRDNFKCTQCEAEDQLHIHHLTYQHIYNELEHLEDLTTLCEMCHKKQHKIIDKDYFITIQSVRSLLRTKGISLRQKCFNEITQNTIKPKPPFVSFPKELILKDDDDYKTQNTKLLIIYFCGVKKLNLTLDKLNIYFDTNYSSIQDAIDNLIDVDLSFENFMLIKIMCGRRLCGYKIRKY